MSATIALGSEADEKVGRTQRFWLWVSLVVVVAAGGIGVWLLSAGDGEPTLSFDGTSAAYSGPEVLGAGNVLFHIENNSDVVADFLWGRHGEEGITFEQASSWNDPDGAPPPWVEDGFHLAKDVAPQKATEKLSAMTPGTYELVVWEVEAGKSHVAALITVEEN